MGKIKKPWTFATSEGLYSHKFTENFDILYDEFNGSLDNTNFKAAANIVGTKFLDTSIPGSKLLARQIGDSYLSYPSVEVLRCGPNAYGNGPNGVRQVSGRIYETITNGNSQVFGWAPFSIVSLEGNPRFNYGPGTVIRLTAIEEVTTLEGRYCTGLYITQKYATGFFYKVELHLAVTFDTSFYIHWVATGGV